MEADLVSGRPFMATVEAGASGACAHKAWPLRPWCGWNFLTVESATAVWQWSKGSVTGVGSAGDGRAYGLSAGVC